MLIKFNTGQAITGVARRAPLFLPSIAAKYGESYVQVWDTHWTLDGAPLTSGIR